MSALVPSRAFGARVRLVVLTTLVAIAATAIASAGDRAAFADVPHRFEIHSSSVVGPMSGDTLAPAVRLDSPAAPVEPVAEPVNRSSCRQDLAGAAMTITIPDISYSCPVYAGGQAMLNSGAVTLISDEAIQQVLADRPGGPGLLWIAGHRTSHGGAFVAVPNLADDAIISVSDGTNTASYRIVSRIYVTVRSNRVVDAHGDATGAATLDSIIRPDHGGNGAARLLLQTCDGQDHRWMIYADLVTA